MIYRTRFFLRRVDTKEVPKKVPEHIENDIMPPNVAESYIDIRAACF